MRFSTTIGFTMSLLAMFGSGCGESKEFKTQESADGTGTTNSNTKKSSSKTGEDDANAGTSGKNDSENTEDPKDEEQEEEEDPIVGNAGLTFFEQKVLPVLQAKCVSCHADPRQPAEIRGPLTVYSYNSMKKKLSVGTSSNDNDLLNKLTNKISHEGGDRCGGKMDVSPCKEIAAWHIVEQGDDVAENPNAGVAGRVFEITSLGKIIGWAYNPNDTTEELSVSFYIDGAAGVGTKLGPIVANRSGADNNTPGNHAFLLDIPLQFRDKKKHTLHAYAIIEGKEIELSAVPYSFTAYALSDAGRAFYNANVANNVTGCGGCHVLSYEQHFYALVSPAPSEGGTATNNVLINKAGVRNGTAHGGGNRCAGGNPCNVFQQWWTREFGTP
jgi:hypothetical protein